MKSILFTALLFFSRILFAQTSDQVIQLAAARATTGQLTTGTKSDLSDAWQYLHGPYKPYNPGKAFSLYLAAAQQGSAQAMNAVGIQYRSGLGIGRDEAQAFTWFKKAASAGYANGWYQLGVMYKYGYGCTLDYAQSYACFEKAAALSDPSGLYSQGYMLYKGLGCTQDYRHALALFNAGAARGNAASMYFIGLCYRNGYGATADKDNARYWLDKASALGYRVAATELATAGPENNISAEDLASRIQAAQRLASAVPDAPLNTYSRVRQNIRTADLEGEYKGYLLQYDYSGEHIIGNDPVNLSLTCTNGSLSGLWQESDTLATSLNAVLTGTSVLFDNVHYNKSDHYSRGKALEIDFKEASLELVPSGDSFYLAGNLWLYSAGRKEPEKPAYVIFSRTGAVVAGNASPVSVYPNPFHDLLTVKFQLKERGDVRTVVYTEDGTQIYSNASGRLEAGDYALPIPLNVAAGSYIVKLYNGRQVSSTVVVRK
jgi:hypothetical protein